MKVSTIGMTLIGLGVWLGAVGAHGASAAECAQIENARERLACFDQLYPVDERSGTLPKITSEPIRPPSALGTVPSTTAGTTQSPVRQPAPPAQPDETSVAWPEPPAAGSGSLFGRDKLDFTSTLTAIRRGEQQAMMFLLANEQVWMQSSPRDLPFKEGDEIRIKSGTVGGYIMRNDAGASTRVKRIR